ncbi:MAG: SUMF1/EgtB/PvdO family nonheme iron enzyme, partial [Acidiferrobacter sp.]
HDVHLPAFAIAERPVSNAAYLRFMEDDGYRNNRYWTHEGRHWRDHAGAEAPWHWRRNCDERWYGVDIAGPIELISDAPVSGLCAYEARAFARYAHARLPHEAEWELAMRDGLLLEVGSAWEWCENRFYPYAGFRAFPYRGYSMPWFDGAHTTLRGASVYSADATRRASFRNFHVADKRHIFSGVRLCHLSRPTH